MEEALEIHVRLDVTVVTPRATVLKAGLLGMLLEV